MSKGRKQEKVSPSEDAMLQALEGLGLRHAAHDWFNEEASKPDLVEARGRAVGEPLTTDLGLFDSEGRLLARQKRSSLVALHDWLGDHDAILAFLFPIGLDSDERARLLDDLAVLAKQPWSPRKGIKAVLDEWPKDEPERDASLAAAETLFREACERFLEEEGVAVPDAPLDGE